MKRRAATTTSTEANGDSPSHVIDVGENDNKSKWRSRKGSAHPLVKVGAAASTATLILTAAASYGGAFPKGRDYLRSLSSSTAAPSGPIFIAIKSTHSNQKRISSILDSYWNFAPQNTVFFTDSPPAKEIIAEPDKKSLPSWPIRSMSDPLLPNPTREIFNIVDTNCNTEHTMEGLCCKTAAEIIYYHNHSSADWLCHADDDTFVNYPALDEYLGEYDPSEEHFIGYASTKFPIEKDRKKKLEEARKNSGGGGDVNVNVRLTGEKQKEGEDTIIVAYATGGAGWCISRTLVDRGIDKLANLAQTCLDIVFSDDVTLGFVIQEQLGVEMKLEKRLHSHLDVQKFNSKGEAMKQLTFGSGFRTVMKPITPEEFKKITSPNTPKDVSEKLLNSRKTKDQTFVEYPGASFVESQREGNKTKWAFDLTDPLGFRALYCDFWPNRCDIGSTKNRIRG